MAGWTYTAVDRIITTHPALLLGVIVLASAGGGDVTVYEGQDATTGQKIGTFEGANNITNSMMFGPGLDCGRGIYVDIGSSISGVIVIWSPLGSA